MHTRLSENIIASESTIPKIQGIKLTSSFNIVDRILEICREYVRLYAARYLSNRPDQVLPISQASFPRGSNISEESPFQSVLRQNAVPIDALSTFVANSGVTIASLTAVSDLARTTRPGLNLDQNIIPCMDQFLELGGCITNGYIVDYFVHGQVGAFPLSDSERN